MDTKHFDKGLIPLTQSTLADGLQVVTGHLKSELILVQWIFRVGSYEDGNWPGLAHFLEHLLFGGPNSKVAHPAVLSMLAAGGHLNGGTGATDTCYHCFGFRKDLEEITQALHTLVFEPDFSAENCEAERKVLIRERARKISQRRQENYVERLLFPEVPWFFSEYPNLGSDTTFENISLDEIKNHYRQFYTPQNAALVVIGDVDHQATIDLASRLPYPDNLGPRIGFYPRQAPKLLEIEQYEHDIPDSLDLYFGLTPVEPRELISLKIVFELLEFAHIGLIETELRLKSRLIYSGGINTRQNYPYRHHLIGADVSRQDFSRTEQKLRGVIRQVIAMDYPESLWGAVMNSLIRRFVCAHELTDHDMADSLASDLLIGGLEPSNRLELVRQTTKEMVAQAAEKYMNPDQYGIIRRMHK